MDGWMDGWMAGWMDGLLDYTICIIAKSLWGRVQKSMYKSYNNSRAGRSSGMILMRIELKKGFCQGSCRHSVR